MPASDLVNLSGLLDDAKCFALVRQHRWPERVRCPGCGSDTVVRDGGDDTQPHRQRYRCKACAGRFDDLTGTALAGHHQPLRVWVLCLYFMGLNLSNRQIALELGLSPSDVQAMTEHLRRGLVAKVPAAVAALEEADRLIQEDPRKAAELYLAETREKLTVDELVEMMRQSGVVFTTTPSATMLMAEQMAKGGTLKTRPKNWKEFFFPFVHAQPGN